VTGSVSPYERLGGEVGLEKIVDDFIDRVTGDMMIGFFFRSIDKERLKRLETQFAASHLGGPAQYEGRPLDVAHAPHPIMGGQFNRRLRILDQTLRDHGVSDEIREQWLQHNESLRQRITRDKSDECHDPLAEGSSKARDERS
jgi:truncated hemoglobin YjbI